MADNRPIGFMDSGLGGLSVMKRAIEVLPNESFVFYGDNLNAPYGNKSMDEIHDLSLACATELISRGVKAIVLACNTATAAAITDMRARFTVPVLSMEPAIKPALGSGSGKILMMATQATCGLERYQKLKKRLDKNGRVIDIACTGLVECIEKNLRETSCVNRVLDSHLSGFRGEIIDGIVLGCTHFPLIEQDIANYARENFLGDCKIFDGREGTVKQLVRVLVQNELLSGSVTRGTVELHTSGDQGIFMPIMERILYET